MWVRGDRELGIIAVVARRHQMTVLIAVTVNLGVADSEKTIPNVGGKLFLSLSSWPRLPVLSLVPRADESVEEGYPVIILGEHRVHFRVCVHCVCESRHSVRYVEVVSQRGQCAVWRPLDHPFSVSFLRSLVSVPLRQVSFERVFEGAVVLQGCEVVSLDQEI